MEFIVILGSLYLVALITWLVARQHYKDDWLSTLIEACGDDFYGIKKTIDTNEWLLLDKEGDYMLPPYKTPNEAVAELCCGE